MKRSYPAEVDDVCDQVRGARHVVVVGRETNDSMFVGADPGAVRVTAPAGINRIDAGEMTVECFAGTPLEELQRALAEVGQRVNLPARGTVGGALAMGRNTVHRLGRGASRDAVLRIDVVGADGLAYRCGGDTVKNVSGFDLCRLHVGAYGTLGVMVTVLLRTSPLPRSSAWLCVPHDAAVRMVSAQWGLTAALSNGRDAYVHCEGHPNDLESVMTRWNGVVVDGPPSLGSHRWSVQPALMETFLADDAYGEIGVGIVHSRVSPPPPAVDGSVRLLNERIRANLDPGRKLNGHIDPVDVPR